MKPISRRLAQSCAVVFGMVIVIASLLFTHNIAYAAGPGSVAFVGFNADGNDGFAIVLLSGADANSNVFFTDNEWDGATFNSGEGSLTWTAPIGGLPAGTVITISDTSSTPITSIGVVTGTLNLDSINEVLYAYQGAVNAPTSFLAVIANEEFATLGGDLLTNTGLTIGTTAVEIDGDEDVMIYSGATIFANETAAVASIGNDANWSTQDGIGDQSQDSISPDFPDDVPTSFIIATPTAVTLSYQAANRSSFGFTPYSLAASLLLLTGVSLWVHQRETSTVE